MAHTIITVNDETIYDGDPGDWKQPIPERIQAMLKPDAKREPWFNSISIPWAQCMATGQPFTADVHTRTDGFTLNITTGEE